MFRTQGHIPTRYSPVRHSPCGAFDLHVLGLPPAFVLSQDQTLKFESMLIGLMRTLNLTRNLTERPAMRHVFYNTQTFAVLSCFCVFNTTPKHCCLCISSFLHDVQEPFMRRSPETGTRSQKSRDEPSRSCLDIRYLIQKSLHRQHRNFSAEAFQHRSATGKTSPRSFLYIGA